MPAFNSQTRRALFPFRDTRRRKYARAKPRIITQPADTGGGAPAGPTVRSSATFAGTGSVTAGVIPLPAGWQAGDLHLIGATSRASGGGLGAAPAGWTAVQASFDASSSTSSHMAVYGRILQAGDTDPTISAASGRLAAVSVAVQNHGLASVTDLVVASDVNGAASTSITAPSVTPADASSLWIAFFGSGDPTTANTSIAVAPPAGMTEIADVSTVEAASTDTGVEAAYLALASGSATGTATATATTAPTPGAVNGMGVSVAVKALVTGVLSIAGAATTTSVAAAAVTLTGALVAAASTVSSAAADLTRLSPVTGTATTTPSAAASLGLVSPVTAAATTTSVAAADLTRISPISGAATTTSVATANLEPFAERTLAAADATTASGTTLAVTPTGQAVGDWLLGVLTSVGGTQAHAAPDGTWTQVGTTGYYNNNLGLSVWAKKVASTGETYTFTIGPTARRGTLAVRAFFGVDAGATSPVEGTPFQTGGGGLTGITHGSQTPAAAGRIWLLATSKGTAAAGSSTMNTPAGFVETSDQVSASGTLTNANSALHWRYVSAATGTQLVDSPDATATNWGGLSVLLSPTAAAVTLALSGAATTTSTAAADLTRVTPLSGAASTTSSAAADLTRVTPVAGAASSTSTAAAALTRVTPITGAASSTSVAAGALNVVTVLPVAGAATTTSVAAGAVTMTGAVVAAASTTSVASATLIAQLVLAGAASTASVSSASLNQLGTLPIAGAATTTSVAVAAVTMRAAVVAGAVTTSVSAATLTLRLVIPAAGAAASTTSVAAGTVGIRFALSGSAATVPVASGSLARISPVSAAAATLSTAAAVLDLIAPPPFTLGVLTGATGPSAVLSGASGATAVLTGATSVL